MYLNEERVFPKESDDGVWYLDTGAMNHMTGCKSALVSLDKSVCGTVWFGDGSKVDICGLGAVMLE